jgi:hypothetical protein
MIQQFRKSLSTARDAGERSCSDVEHTLGLVQACFRRIAVQILMVCPPLSYYFHI